MLFRGFSSDLCYYWDSRFQGRKTRSRTGGREIAIPPTLPIALLGARCGPAGPSVLAAVRLGPRLVCGSVLVVSVGVGCVLALPIKNRTSECAQVSSSVALRARGGGERAAPERKATMARKAEEARRAAAGDDPDARDVQDADAERNRLDRGSEVDQMRERLRQLEELVAEREGIDLRQAQLDENAGSLMQRRVSTTRLQTQPRLPRQPLSS